MDGDDVLLELASRPFFHGLGLVTVLTLLGFGLVLVSDMAVLMDR